MGTEGSSDVLEGIAYSSLLELFAEFILFLEDELLVPNL